MELNQKSLLNEMVNEFIHSLNFGKSMRWASRTDSFIRPIRSLSIILGKRLLMLNYLVLNHQTILLQYRMVSYEPFTYSFIGIISVNLIKMEWFYIQMKEEKSF